MSEQRLKRIKACLQANFGPCDIVLEDEGHKHRGHPGAKAGGGHFKLQIRSKKFTPLTSIACHRLIYQALDEMMGTDIHALSISVLK